LESDNIQSPITDRNTNSNKKSLNNKTIINSYKNYDINYELEIAKKLDPLKTFNKVENLLNKLRTKISENELHINDYVKNKIKTNTNDKVNQNMINSIKKALTLTNNNIGYQTYTNFF